MDITLFALLILSIVLVGLHAPYLTLTLVLVIGLAILATRLSWAILSAFMNTEAPQAAWERIKD